MLRLLFANNPLPLWIYDLETLRFFGCYDVACQTYRYTREEFLTLTIRDILPQEDVPQLGVSVQTASPGIFTSGIWRHRKRDGSILHVEILSHEILYKGWRTRFVCPIDVTERLRIEDARARLATALQEREAGLRRVQLMVRLAHVIARSDGTFESWSESLPQLGGLDALAMALPGRMVRTYHRRSS